MWPTNRTYVSPDRTDPLDGRWGDRTLLMGIVNATPDSFSNDGVDKRVDDAVASARHMIANGARIIDVGGESTRPDAPRVSPAAQISRVVPIIEAIVSDLATFGGSAALSVDTTCADVAEAALQAGATIVNDVSGTTDDSDLPHVAAAHGATYVTMHNQRGREHTDLIDDIRRGLDQSLAALDAAGIQTIVIDPGFGFGWTVAQNTEMLRRLPELWDYRLPILTGTSRKSAIGAVLDHRPVDQRLWGTAATVAQTICAGADIVRVHDVAEMADVARVTDAIVRR